MPLLLAQYLYALTTLMLLGTLIVYSLHSINKTSIHANGVIEGYYNVVSASIVSNTQNDETDSLVTSITFVVIALHLQISEECNYYILALTYLF
jgi:hypothetical protein